MTFIEEKKFIKVQLCACWKNLNFSYWNLHWAACQHKKIWRKFSFYSSVKFCLFQTFGNISSILFPFNLLLVSLLTLPPTLQKISVAWRAYYVVYTLHISLYRRALGITTMVDWRRVRDRGVERNFKMFSCFQCFKIKNPLKFILFLFYKIARCLFVDSDMKNRKENTSSLSR